MICPKCYVPVAGAHFQKHMRWHTAADATNASEARYPNPIPVHTQPPPYERKISTEPDFEPIPALIGVGLALVIIVVVGLLVGGW
jgi:hypothetical protein